MTAFATPAGDLNIRRIGAGPPLVALHGFTHHGGAFTELAGLLDTQIVAPDLPGHGETRVVPSISGAVVAVAALVEALGPPRPVLGYSQGGRIALHLALARPDVVSRLVLVSTAPGIADPGGRRFRRERDEALADRIEAIGTGQFLDEWLGGPVAGTAGIRDEAWRQSDRARREENDASALAAALRAMSQGNQEYLGDRLGEMQFPVLVIVGESDTRYVAVAADMVRRLPAGRLAIVPGAPHNVVGSHPAELAGLVRWFLAEAPSP